jgi:hypothetical protein
VPSAADQVSAAIVAAGRAISGNHYRNVRVDIVETDKGKIHNFLVNKVLLIPYSKTVRNYRVRPKVF